MSLTLDEAIKHAEEVAEEKEKDARFYTFSRPDNYRKESSEKCAAKHRQLAEWLKELKRLRNQNSKETIKLIPYLMHKEMGISILKCQKAYNIAIDYLRSQGKLKG